MRSLLSKKRLRRKWRYTASCIYNKTRALVWTTSNNTNFYICYFKILENILLPTKLFVIGLNTVLGFGVSLLSISRGCPLVKVVGCNGVRWTFMSTGVKGIRWTCVCNVSGHRKGHCCLKDTILIFHTTL